MATIKSEVQTPVSLTVSGLSSLNPASNLYCVSPILNHATNDPLDVLIDVSVTTTNTPTNNKQVVVFAKGSLTGNTAEFGSGPESGTSTTDEADLHYVGSVPMNSSGTHRKIFSLAAAFGGVLPIASKLIFKDDLGVALTGAAVQTSEVWGVN